MRVTYVLDHRGSGSIAAQTVVSGIYSFRALLQRNARNTTCIDHLMVQSLEFAEQQFPDALMQWIVTLVDLAQNPGDEHAATSAADDGDTIATMVSWLIGNPSERKIPHVATVGSRDNHVWDFGG